MATEQKHAERSLVQYDCENHHVLFATVVEAAQCFKQMNWFRF